MRLDGQRSFVDRLHVGVESGHNEVVASSADTASVENVSVENVPVENADDLGAARSAIAGHRSASQLGPLESLARAGLIDPAHLGALAWSAGQWGAGIAAPADAAARRFPHRTALIDDYGSLTWADLRRRSDRLTSGLVNQGFTRFDRVAVACGNHRGFVEATLAAAKLGCRTVLMNPTLGGPQLAGVVQSEGISVIVHDAAISELVATAVPGALSVAVDPARDSAWSFPSVEPAPARRWSPSLRPAPMPVMMTSGTTGTPKGAERKPPPIDLEASTGLLRMIPYHLGDVAVIPAPLFHAWGFANLTMMTTMAGTVVLTSRFDPATILALINEHQPRVLALVPVMLSRLLEAVIEADGDDGTETAAPRSPLSIPEIVASSGSAIAPSLVERWLALSGPNLYNLYGSTEVGQATIANPIDLGRHPSTAGRVVPGSTVEILDPAGAALPPGETGAIYVANSFGFDQYTDGGDKARIGRLTATGDTGYLTEDGLLFVVGREDDMIVSGGENVFPAEVEELLAAHPDIAEAAVIAVADEEFGQRLAAHVVKRKGARMTKAQVRAHVRSELAPYKVPREVYWSKELPRTTTGKIRRNQLAS